MWLLLNGAAVIISLEAGGLFGLTLYVLSAGVAWSLGRYAASKNWQPPRSKRFLDSRHLHTLRTLMKAWIERLRTLEK